MIEHAYYNLSSMELALNLVWVGVAIAGIVLQWITLSRAARSSDSSASTTQKIVAMSCALVILFFVISMTDDLHDQQVLIEEKNVCRIAASTEAPPKADSARPTPIGSFVFSPPPAFSLSTLAIRRGIEASVFRLPAAVDRETLCGRAPPVSRL